MTEYKVIFHIDESKKWNLVLANTRNLIAALKESKVTVEILANSEAVKDLVSLNQTADPSKSLRELSSHVNFAACNNSLHALGIEPTALFDFVTVVPSGVAELAIKQHETYAYIKP